MMWRSAIRELFRGRVWLTRHPLAYETLSLLHIHGTLVSCLSNVDLERQICGNKTNELSLEFSR
jgi:hypothetical protein